MAKRKVVNVDISERGLFLVDEDLKECDFCDEMKVCASINNITMDVMCVCKDCLQNFINAFDDKTLRTSWNDLTILFK